MKFGGFKLWKSDLQTALGKIRQGSQTEEPLQTLKVLGFGTTLNNWDTLEISKTDILAGFCG